MTRAPAAAPHRVLVVGGGAAGLAAAWSLSRFPDRFSVEVWEKGDVPGGVATSESVSFSDAPASTSARINDGVQGGTSSYRNTLLLHGLLGHRPKPVKMTVSFGAGAYNWSNHTPTPLLKELAGDIKRFGSVLRWISRLELLFVFMPISLVLWLFGFSHAFAYRMVFPLTALFFGTGNQTASVSAAIVARVFLDPDLRLFDYDPERLLSQSPEMFSFGDLRQIYADLVAASAPGATVHCRREVSCVSRSGARTGGVVAVDGEGRSSTFDSLVLACDAETAGRLLGPGATRSERRLLACVDYFDDVTVTHSDEAYMRRHYVMHDDPADMYFIRVDDTVPAKVEMSFNLSAYQMQGGAEARIPKVYQTIFLDRKDEARW